MCIPVDYSYSEDQGLGLDQSSAGGLWGVVGGSIEIVRGVWSKFTFPKLSIFQELTTKEKYHEWKKLGLTSKEMPVDFWNEEEIAIDVIKNKPKNFLEAPDHIKRNLKIAAIAIGLEGV